MGLTQGIHRALQQHPHAPALKGIFQQTAADGQMIRQITTLDWRTFADRVARFAAGLQACGVGPGDRVAVLARNVPQMVEAYFAVLWAGGVLVTINTRWGAREQIHCLNDSGARVLLLDTAFSAQRAVLAAGATAPLTVLWMAETPGSAGGIEMLIASHQPVQDVARGGDDLAALFYTGGTTGLSKGVMLSHNNFIANAMTAVVNLGLDAETTHLHVSPLFHLAGGSRVFSTTVAGGTHATLDVFEPEQFLAAIEQLRVNVTVVVPTMLMRLIRHPDFGQFDLSSLRLLTYGASPMPEAVLKEAMDKLPGVQFLQSYGMTELSPVATMLLPRYHTFSGPDAGYTRSAGQAVFNCDVAVMDAQDQCLPVGQIGEVCVRGPMVMQGYWRQPEKTAEALRNGWMHTGDAGYLDERGFLFLVDRVKDMIISGGENVYSAAVEDVIYQVPGVRECAVIGIPSETWGEAVHAIVVPVPGQALNAESIVQHCRSVLAGFQCPKSVEFRDEELPKSGVGKILKNALREPYWRNQQRSIH